MHRNPGTYVFLGPHHHLHIHGVEVVLRRVAGKVCFAFVALCVWAGVCAFLCMACYTQVHVSITECDKHSFSK